MYFSFSGFAHCPPVRDWRKPVSTHCTPCRRPSCSARCSAPGRVSHPPRQPPKQSLPRLGDRRVSELITQGGDTDETSNESDGQSPIRELTLTNANSRAFRFAHPETAPGDRLTYSGWSFPLFLNFQGVCRSALEKNLLRHERERHYLVRSVGHNGGKTRAQRLVRTYLGSASSR